VQDTEAPKYSDNSTNNTAAGQPTLFSLNWTDNVGLGGYIFSTNNTGTWKNDSFVRFINKSVAATSTTASFSHPYERKAFSANGRYWVFYSDGTDAVYKTSTDGISWSSTNVVKSGEAYGSDFSVWFNGTNVFYADQGG